MIKNLLLATLVCTCGLGAAAATSQTTYTYASPDNLNALGYKGIAQTYGTAICIANPAMAGMKVTSITGYINTNRVADVEMWLTTDLVSDTKEVSVPVPVSEIVPVMLGKEEVYKISVTLPEPYVLTKDNVFVGYTLKVPVSDDMGTYYPIIISQDNMTPYGLYWYASVSAPQWTNDMYGYGVSYIEAGIEKEDLEYGLNINSVDSSLAVINEGFTNVVSVCNIGDNVINTITYTYQVNEGDVITKTKVLESPIYPDLASYTTVVLDFDAITESGEHLIDFSISEVESHVNTNVPTYSGTFIVSVLPQKSIRRPLVEEYTGLWCGWCPRGFFAMEEIAKEYGDRQVSLCYHNNDAMMVTSVYPVPVEAAEGGYGYPESSVDRSILCDPYYGSTYYTQGLETDFGIYNDIQNHIDVVPLADIDVQATPIDNNTIEVTSTVTFYRTMSAGNYKIGYVLASDGLSNESWRQTNYFAYPQYRNQFQGTPLEELTTWGASVRGLVFNDVVVNATAMMGVENSVPSSVKFGESFTHKYTLRRPSNRDLAPDMNKLSVAAFVIDASNGFIENANKFYISGWDGVEGIEAANEETEAVYYDLAGRRVLNPEKGVYVKVQGDKTAKVIL